MAEWRRVHTKFWSDSEMFDLSPEDKLFYLCLLTNPKTTACGVYEIHHKELALFTGYNLETISQLIQRFIEYGKIRYDQESRELIILNWFRYNPPRSPKIEALIKTEISEVKTQEYRQIVVKALKAYSDQQNYTLSENFDTLSEKFYGISPKPIGNDSVQNSAEKIAKPIVRMGSQKRYTIDTVSKKTAVDVDVDLDKDLKTISYESDTHKKCTNDVRRFPSLTALKGEGGRYNYPQEFESFWDKYPRRIAKPAAYTAWRAAVNSSTVTPEELVRCAENYALYCKQRGTTEEYMQHPATFCQAAKRRWEDFREPPKPPATSKQPQSHLAGENINITGDKRKEALEAWERRLKQPQS